MGVNFYPKWRPLPSFIGAGTGSQGGGNRSPTFPTGVIEGDQMVCFFGQCTYTAGGQTAPTTPTGWNLKTTYTNSTGSNFMRHSLYTRTFETGDTAPTITAPAAVNNYAIIFVFRYVRGSDDPTDILGSALTDTSSGTTVGAVTGFTPNISNDVIMVFTSKDDTSTSGTLLTTAENITWAQLYFNSSGSGISGSGATSGSSHFGQYGIQTTAVTIASKTVTMAGNSAQGLASMWSIYADSPQEKMVNQNAAVTGYSQW